mmetsp:Transcript_56430/g.127314  ORF Transcript_56430/g.127314 Transcript_56430/m.127314 type:complete len:571 (-) Transcript_56430:552-2264(-)
MLPGWGVATATFVAHWQHGCSSRATAADTGMDINWKFQPPTDADFAQLAGWDPWWLPDFLNGALAPVCKETKNFKSSGMLDIRLNTGGEYRPNKEADEVVTFEPFDTESDDLEDELCGEHDDDYLDGEEEPADACKLFHPPSHFGGTSSSDLVISCKVVRKNAEASAEGLLDAAKVDQFPDGWWQNSMFSHDWKRWFISGYASLRELEAVLFDMSSEDIAMNAAMYSLPTPSVTTNSAIDPRGTLKSSSHAAHIDRTKDIAGPLYISKTDGVDLQPSTMMDFGRFLSMGRKPVEFESIYIPRRGSLHHAAEMNTNEDIVLFFVIPMATKSSRSSPFCSSKGWKGIVEEGQRQSVEMLKNMIRPLFKTSCQYYHDNIVGNRLANIYYDFSQPRKRAFESAEGNGAVETWPTLKAWESQTCPCAFQKLCKYQNFLEDICPEPVEAVKTAPPKKPWVAYREWLGAYADERKKYEGCVHKIKRIDGKLYVTFQTGRWKDVGKFQCAGATGLRTQLVELESIIGELNVVRMKLDDENIDLRLNRRKVKGLYSYYIKRQSKPGGEWEVIWHRNKKV